MFRCPGSKAQLAPALSALIPQTKYVSESYGGSLRLTTHLLRDPNRRDTRFIVGDTDPAVTNFWRCVKFRNRELCDNITSLFNSLDTDQKKEEWYLRNRRILRLSGAYRSHPERAAAMFAASQFCFFGMALKNEPFRLGPWLHDPRIPNAVLRIRELQEPFERVDVRECDSWDLVDECDPNETWHFFDPPYKYRGGRVRYLSDIDHARFFERLTTTDIRWLLTYDADFELRWSWKKSGLWLDNAPMGRVYHHSRKARTEFIVRSIAPSEDEAARYRSLCTWHR